MVAWSHTGRQGIRFSFDQAKQPLICLLIGRGRRPLPHRQLRLRGVGQPFRCGHQMVLPGLGLSLQLLSEMKSPRPVSRPHKLPISRRARAAVSRLALICPWSLMTVAQVQQRAVGRLVAFCGKNHAGCVSIVSAASNRLSRYACNFLDAAPQYDLHMAPTSRASHPILPSAHPKGRRSHRRPFPFVKGSTGFAEHGRETEDISTMRRLSYGLCTRLLRLRGGPCFRSGHGQAGRTFASAT